MSVKWAKEILAGEKQLLKLEQVIINLYKLREEPSPRDNVRLYTGYSHNPQPMNKHSLKGPSINPHSLKQIQTPHSYPQTNFIQNTNILPKKFKFTQPHNFFNYYEIN
jgi:hypothetical protein